MAKSPGLQSPDGSMYVTQTDGAGNLLNPAQVTVLPVGGTVSMANSQVSVLTTQTLICAARPNRVAVMITNLGTNNVYVGNTGVTTSNGDLLIGAAGASVTIPTTAAIYGVASSTQSVSVLEVY